MDYEVDLANQIHNSWKKDSILAIVNSENEFKFALRLRASTKKFLKRKYILEDKSYRTYNNKVCIMIYSYCIFRLLELNFDGEEKIKIKLCRDHRPERLVIKHFGNICNFFNKKELCNSTNIKFRKRTKEFRKIFKLAKKLPKIPKSAAHKYADKVRRKRRADYTINKHDIEKLCRYIEGQKSKGWV